MRTEFAKNTPMTPESTISASTISVAVEIGAESGRSFGRSTSKMRYLLAAKRRGNKRGCMINPSTKCLMRAAVPLPSGNGTSRRLFAGGGARFGFVGRADMRNGAAQNLQLRSVAVVHANRDEFRFRSSVYA